MNDKALTTYAGHKIFLTENQQFTAQVFGKRLTKDSYKELCDAIDLESAKTPFDVDKLDFWPGDSLAREITGGMKVHGKHVKVILRWNDRYDDCDEDDPRDNELGYELLVNVAELRSQRGRNQEKQAFAERVKEAVEREAVARLEQAGWERCQGRFRGEFWVSPHQQNRAKTSDIAAQLARLSLDAFPAEAPPPVDKAYAHSSDFAFEIEGKHGQRFRVKVSEE